MPLLRRELRALPDFLMAKWWASPYLRSVRSALDRSRML
jgi:hypothetical protein